MGSEAAPLGQTMGSEAAPLKLFFLPFLVPSHLFPEFQIARCFASRGQHVTFFTTPSSVPALEATLKQDATAGHTPITLLILPLPNEKVGLPDGVDFSSDFDYPTSLKLYEALNLLRPEIQRSIESTRADCIISDKFYPWSADFATDLGIPRIVYHSYGIFGQALQEAISRPDSPHYSLQSDDEPFVVPDLPDPITLTRSQLPVGAHAQLFHVLREAELKSYGGIANSFYELESAYTEHYKKVMSTKIFHIGPVDRILRSSGKPGKAYLKSAIGDDEFTSWLNSKPPNSVLYVSFGTYCKFPDAQLMELACGLESSGCDFIWVVKGKERNEAEEDADKWLPEGYEERIKGRGMIVRGWAPQVMILEHESVGGFLTHCGLNSFYEAVSAGVPLVTWPLYSEQFYNEKLVTQVLGTGVAVGSEDWCLWVDLGKNLVKREKIEKAVRRLMKASDGSDKDEVDKIRRNAKELSVKAKRAVEEGGSSYRDTTLLIDELKQLRDRKAVV